MRIVRELGLAAALVLAAGGAMAAAPAPAPGAAGLFGGGTASGETIDLSPGDMVVLKLTPGPGPLAQTVVAKGSEAAGHTLAEGEIRLTFAGGEMTMLKVESRYPKRLHYQARIGGQRTSVCPVMPGVFAMETWMQPIGRITVGPFREVGDDFNMCV